jgi:hypothetical protein
LTPVSDRIAPLVVILLNRVIVPSICSPLFHLVRAGLAMVPIRDSGKASTACVHGSNGLAGTRQALELFSHFPDSAPGQTNLSLNESSDPCSV